MSSLSERIYNLESVRFQLDAIIIDSVCTGFPSLEWKFNKEELQSRIDWNNILTCASVIHQSNKFEHLDASLRISQHCFNSDKTSELQKSSAALILEALTNKESIKLAIRRNLLPQNYKDYFPLMLQFEIIARDVENSILNTANNLIPLNKFQTKVYESYLTNDSISISAPTSSGKSFILERVILKELSDKNVVKNIIYIVPTRALLNQVENEFMSMIKENDLPKVYISTVPQRPEEKELQLNKIFIFTQERLHWFRIDNPDIEINFLIIDEAQKIEDGTRGILLQQKIEELISSFPNIKVFFSSPSTSNPEILLRDLPETFKKSTVNTEFVSVNQNLIFISSDSLDPYNWKMNLILKEGNISVGDFKIKHRADSDRKRLTFITESLCDNSGGNLIYVNGAAEAEKHAQVLFDLLGEEYAYISVNVKNLIELVKKTVHEKYALVKMLQRKIAFHYGSMPLLIKQEIEKLFKSGDIHFIFCTSTLLEGVNLPTKNLFLLNPHRGRNNPLSMTDFWNLAGRAGRWGKEFQGNIICIQPELWVNTPTATKDQNKIEKALDKLSTRIGELKSFIETGTPRDSLKENMELEYGFTYFYSNYLNNGTYSFNQPEFLLKEVFDQLKDKITLPNSIIFKNPGISPIAQQNLYEYFVNYEKDITGLIPWLPEVFDSAKLSYVPIINRINKYLSGGVSAISFPRAITIVSWMKGYSLAAIISMKIDYNEEQIKKNKKSKKLDTLIRETMDEIENFVRFEFAKYSSCYLDILSYYFHTIERNDLIDKIPKLNLWLEFGVSSQTQISFISLGLSRNTAISLSEIIANDKLIRSEALNWLKSNDVTMLGLSPIIVEELQLVIDIHSE